jgi:nicotinate-nucleotide pyrophosphorylase (carboxylating)
MTERQSQPVSLTDFLPESEARALIERARGEDLGPADRDITSEVCIPAAAHGRGLIRARDAGRVAGLALLPIVADVYDPAVSVQLQRSDGATVAPDELLAEIAGPMRSLLSLERIALNLISHLSGIASHTARFVHAVADTPADIYDTRKTLPGLRPLQKYAVACGGGRTHRMGLYEAVLIKDNHLAYRGDQPLETYLANAIADARSRDGVRFVEVEVDTLQQLQKVLQLEVDIILLDNMAPATLREAVKQRDTLSPGVALEASGGINLSTVEEIARAGVERISIGALTHSPPSFDIALDVG